MAAQPRPRVKRLKAVGLGLGGLDDLPHIDAHAVADDGHLVRKADVDVAVGVLQQLLHLGHGGGRDLVDAAGQHAAVQRRGDLGGVAPDAADHLGGVFGLVLLVAGVHALR